MISSSCSPLSPENAAFGKFTGSFSSEIEKDYGFQTYGVGASMPFKIEDIRLCFMAKYPVELEQARKITVPITLKFIQRMNEDKILMKYLANSPASLKNVELVISFKETYNGCLESVMLIGSKNLVRYVKFNEARTGLIDIHRETFDEAVNILHQKSN